MFPFFGKSEDKGKQARSRPRSKSVRSGLWFPVGRVHRYMKRDICDKRIGPKAAVFLAATLEYLCAEILEMAGQLAKDNRRVKIIPRILQLTIRNDDELDRLLKAVTIPRGGVMPRIHSTLVAKKPTRHRVKRLAEPKPGRQPNKRHAKLPNEAKIDPTAKSNDCLMVMEKVQVDINPSALLFARADDDSDVEETAPVEPEMKNEPISLLASSDEDDVIIVEPHIDTVEVSDETDEDDLPLTRLVKADLSESKVSKMCQFSSQFVRHKKKHKDGKIFSCHLCDYKAKHHMSLIYHLRSHGFDERSARMKLDIDKSKCPKCNVYYTNVKGEFGKHYRECEGVVSKHRCTKCKYSTTRSSDLKRHVIKKHLRKRKSKREDEDEDDEDEDSDEDDDYEA